MTDRIVILLDMDCFYVQVEERDNPHIKGNPAAVVQYNSWKGGGIIAVNYEARAFGVKRGMRGDEAKEKCPNINLIQVPTQRGKADLTKYRNAGKEVLDVLCEFSTCVERASIDEAYIDVTQVIESKMRSNCEIVQAKDLPSTWVVGFDVTTEDVPPSTVRMQGLLRWMQEGLLTEEANTCDRLTQAALLCENMRKRVLEITGFKCSAGISHNKVLGKLACGLHKPNQQSILPMKSVPGLWAKMPIGKVRNLGGKLGDSLVSDFKCETMEDLSKLSLERLRTKYEEKTACWLRGLGQGVDHEQVVSRQLPKSIGCSKNFSGKEALNSKEKVKTWMKGLAEELSERLNEDEETNDRVAKTLTVHVRTGGDGETALSRSCPLSSYKADTIARIALSLIASTNSASGSTDRWSPPIKNISLSAGKFECSGKVGTMKIDDIFKKVDINSKKVEKIRTHEGNQDGHSSRKLDANVNSSGNKTSLNIKKKTQKRGKKANKKDICQKSILMQLTRKVEVNSAANLGTNTNKENDAPTNGDIKDSNSFQIVDSIYDESTDEDEVQILETSTNNSKVCKLKESSSSLWKSDAFSTVSSSDKSCNRDTNASSSTSSSSIMKKVSYRSLEEDTNYVSIEELFPDLDNVDASLMEMLPPQLQKRARQAVEEHSKQRGRGNHSKVRPIENEDSNIETGHAASSAIEISSIVLERCEECNKMVATEKLAEHRDFHFASDLRKKQMSESKVLMVSGRKGKFKRGKTRDNSSKRTKILPSAKIDDYFCKKKINIGNDVL